MKKKKINNSKLFSKRQLKLYGFESYFSKFNKLFAKRKLPNTLLISGQKGIGKSVFINHFVNYLLSTNEINKYDLINFTINTYSHAYKLFKNNIHPNVFNIYNEKFDKNIGVDEIRNLINFLNKSSNLNNLKFVIIDNFESLNKNSSNALLKVLEEPKKNTYFFLIFDNENKILSTIKSRCSEFKIFFSKEEKNKIFEKLINEYKIELFDQKLLDLLNYESPGNLLNYIISTGDLYFEFSNLKVDFIINCIKKYEVEKDPNLLKTIIFLIQNFYHENCFKNINNINNYLNEYKNISNKFYYLKKYNLNEKTILKSISDSLKNE